MAKRKINNCKGPCILCSKGLKLRTCTLPLGVNGFHPATDDALIGELIKIKKRAKLITAATEVVMLTRNIALIETELKERKLI